MNIGIESIRNLQARVRELYHQHRETQAALIVAQFCNKNWPVEDGPYNFEKVISQGINTGGDSGWTYRPEMIAEFCNLRDRLVFASQGKPKTRSYLERFSRIQNGLNTLLNDHHHFLWRGNPAALQEFPLVPVSKSQLLHFVHSYYEDYQDL